MAQGGARPKLALTLAVAVTVVVRRCRAGMGTSGRGTVQRRRISAVGNGAVALVAPAAAAASERARMREEGGGRVRRVGVAGAFGPALMARSERGHRPRPPRGNRTVEQGGRVVRARERALEWASAHWAVGWGAAPFFINKTTP
jgi:hypothetical protein